MCSRAWSSALRHLFDAANRQHIWAASLRLFWQHPVFGVGLDAFQLAFARERTVDYWLVEWNGSPTKAHNELLHVLATQGLFGAVAALGLTMGLAAALVRAVRRAEVANRPWLVAVAAGVAGFYVQNLVSFTVVGCGALAVVLAAIASRLASDPQDVEPDRPSRLAVWVVSSAVLVLVAVFHNTTEDAFLERPARLVGALVVVVSLCAR